MFGIEQEGINDECPLSCLILIGLVGKSLLVFFFFFDTKEKVIFMYYLYAGIYFIDNTISSVAYL